MLELVGFSIRQQLITEVSVPGMIAWTYERLHPYYFISKLDSSINAESQCTLGQCHYAPVVKVASNDATNSYRSSLRIAPGDLGC